MIKHFKDEVRVCSLQWELGRVKTFIYKETGLIHSY